MTAFGESAETLEQAELIKKSGLFDEKWYLAQYPDVKLLGVDPFKHYLTIGAKLYRSPGPNFSAREYVANNPEIKSSGIDPLYHFLKRAETTSSSPQASPPPPAAESQPISTGTQPKQDPRDADDSIDLAADELDKRLWGGFSSYALPALEALKNNPSATQSEREKAAWALMAWYYVEEDFQRAYENILFVDIFSGKFDKKRVVAELQCLIKMRRFDEANRRLAAALAALGDAPDLLLLKASLAGLSPACPDDIQLESLNAILTSTGLAPIEKRDPAQPLHYSNIVSRAEPRPGVKQKYKVSVIMPVYNAAGTVAISIRSLLAQTWRNIEIIAVDDCSTDDTCRVIDEIAAQDSRVILIRKDVNEGAYPSRNVGIKKATGDFIMVHDSDDWSHPQKVEIQVSKLRETKNRMAVISHWIRVDEFLRPVGTWRPGGSLFSLNFSALLVKREVIEKLGPWDQVRVSADAEFRFRIQAYYGKDATYKMPPHLILSMALSREDSLTRTKATHVRTLHYGLRWLYGDAYKYWHSQDGFKGDPKINGAKVRYPVPRGNKSKNTSRENYDVIVVSDLALKGGAFVSTLNYIVGASMAGKRVAVVHWRKYELSPISSINSRLYDACVTHGIDILSPGDEANADTVLVGYPAVLQHKPDALPDIATKNLIVIVNQFANRLVNGGDQQYDPRVARVHLKSVFGQEGWWVPISPWVKFLMDEDKRYPAPYAEPWFPMIDTSLWCKNPLRWRGDSGGSAVIGRHGRDAYTKWPTNLEALKSAYGVGQNWEVRFLGGAEVALQRLGEQPANWNIIKFDGISVPEFLSGLDFFVHFPHEEYIEEFGRAIMEAMAIGIPVILPEQFRQTFGKAASYAVPGDVPRLVASLWEDRKAYLKQAGRGRDFVNKYCDIAKFDDRLNRLLRHYQGS